MEHSICHYCCLCCANCVVCLEWSVCFFSVCSCDIWCTLKTPIPLDNGCLWACVDVCALVCGCAPSVQCEDCCLCILESISSHALYCNNLQHSFFFPFPWYSCHWLIFTFVPFAHCKLLLYRQEEDETMPCAFNAKWNVFGKGGVLTEHCCSSVVKSKLGWVSLNVFELLVSVFYLSFSCHVEVDTKGKSVVCDPPH